MSYPYPRYFMKQEREQQPHSTKVAPHTFYNLKACNTSFPIKAFTHSMHTKAP